MTSFFKKFFLSLLVLSIVTFNQRLLWASFIASPMRFDAKANAEEAKTFSFTLKNLKEREIKVKLYLNDFEIDREGKEINANPGEIKRNCSTWIKLSNNELVLQPNQPIPVSFEMAIPSNSTGTYWSIIYIEEISEPTKMEVQGKGSGSFQLGSLQRIGIRVYVTINGSQPGEAVIENIDVVRMQPQNKVQIKSYIKNTGSTLLTAKGNIEISNDKGDILEEQNFEKLYLYPYSTRLKPITLEQDLPKGTYTALTIVDYGAADLIAGEFNFEVEQ